MSVKAKHSKNAGLTLVELLVACTMLSIIVVPLLHSFVSSARLGLKARQKLRITTAAQDIMEGLKAESIESLSCSFNYPDDDIAAAEAAPGTPISRKENSFKNFHVVAKNLVGGGKSGNLYELRATMTGNQAPDGDRAINVINISGRGNGHMGDFGSKDEAKADLAATTKATTEEKPVDPSDPSNTEKVTVVTDYDFYGKSNKKYYFAIRDMHVEDAADPYFTVDVLIELDGSNYTDKGTKKKESADGSQKALLNEHGRINYGAFNEKRDAFFVQDDVLGRQTAQEFNIKYAPPNAECTEKDLCRKYVITTTDHTALDPAKTAADGAHWITVTCQVTYSTSPASSFKVPDTHPDYAAAGADKTYSRTYEYKIFDNKATGYVPDNIFFCYYPGYGAPAADEIIYVNEHKVPSILHIIKQEGKDNSTLSNDEFFYKCRVAVNEGAGAAADHKGTGDDRKQSVTSIRTNLDTNLYKIYMPSAPDCNMQGTYVYNDQTFSRTLSKPEDILIYPLGGEQMTSDSMYDVTIDIYKKGTLAKTLGLEGEAATKKLNNKDILFTLKGSMN